MDPENFTILMNGIRGQLTAVSALVKKYEDRMTEAQLDEVAEAIFEWIGKPKKDRPKLNPLPPR